MWKHINVLSSSGKFGTYVLENKYAGCLKKQLTHISWHNFVNFNAFLILFQI